MVDLLIFFERVLMYTVPAEARAWLREHVDPTVAIEWAHALHLLWLSSLCEEHTAREFVRLCFARIEVRSRYLATQEDLEEEGAGEEADAALTKATARLRAVVLGNPWWAELVRGWDARQSRGLGVVRYSIRGKDVEPVRGTRVGRFAVRELSWADAVPEDAPPALRHREQTPRGRHREVGPRRVYAIDLVETGQSLGTFASAAVAFEVADRFDREGVISGPVPPALQKLLDAYRGGPPHVEARSWPAEPHWSFGTCLRRAMRRARLERRGEEVRHAPV